jgi:hypothetical protein
MKVIDTGSNLVVITRWYKLLIPSRSYHSPVVIKCLSPLGGTTEQQGSKKSLPSDRLVK